MSFSASGGFGHRTYNSAGIKDQVGGTCYAHAAARVLNRLLRKVGGFKQDLNIDNFENCYDRILNWIVNKYKGAGGREDVVMEDAIKNLPFIDEKLRPHLRLHIVNLGPIDAILPQKLKDAINQHYEIACSFGLSQNQWDEVHIVMEKAKYGSLRSVKESDLKLSSLDILYHLVDALVYLEKHKIVHGDICPDNILIDVGNVAKLADFGAMVKYDKSNYHSIMVRGHDGYIAPEVKIAGDKDLKKVVTSKVDIFALGKVFIYLVSGNPSTELAAISTSLLSAHTRDIIESCLERDPSRRPTAKVIFDRLREKFIFGVNTIVISGIKGCKVDALNSPCAFDPTEELHGGVTVYRMREDADKWLEYGGVGKMSWNIKSTDARGMNRAWASVSTASACLPEAIFLPSTWKVSTAGNDWIDAAGVTVSAVVPRIVSMVSSINSDIENGLSYANFGNDWTIDDDINLLEL